MKEKKTFDELVNEALDNAKHDRTLALDAYANIKSIYTDIDTSSTETMSAVLLIGQNAVKLLEQSSRSNEQIIRLAQLKEKESRDKEEKNEDAPISLEDVLKYTKSQNGG